MVWFFWGAASVSDGPLPIGEVVGTAAFVGSAAYAGYLLATTDDGSDEETETDIDDEHKQKKCCKPCEPPVGTIATEVHHVPPSKPHYPIKGSHVHWFKMNQSPYPKCVCFWKRNYQKPTPGNEHPPGTVPVTPASGGGPM